MIQLTPTRHAKPKDPFIKIHRFFFTLPQTMFSIENSFRTTFHYVIYWIPEIKAISQ